MNHWKSYWIEIPCDCDEAINTMKVKPMSFGGSNEIKSDY